MERVPQVAMRYLVQVQAVVVAQKTLRTRGVTAGKAGHHAMFLVVRLESLVDYLTALTARPE